jgi:PAS domain S-box-containing protein
VWSEELYRIYGLDPAQPRQKPLYDDPNLTVFTEEGREQVRAAVAKTLADGLPYELELEFTRPDGTTGWVVGRGEAIRDRDGRIIGVSGTGADITKLKELQRLRDEWTSVIAHDLRQPIGTILMASDFLPEVHEDMAEKERTLVERVHAAGLTLKRMVDDLLDMSLVEANRLKLERTAIKPESLVQETLSRLAHLPGIERVHVSSDANLAPVPVDPMRIEQVITNLVTNAIKYGDEHTDIDIRVTQRANASEIAVTKSRPRNRAGGAAAAVQPVHALQKGARIRHRGLGTWPLHRQRRCRGTRRAAPGREYAGRDDHVSTSPFR